MLLHLRSPLSWSSPGSCTDSSISSMPLPFETRVGSYGVIVRDGKVLLSQYMGDGGAHWTLPGGGLELGEDPPTAAMREIYEETGYEARLDELLGVDSLYIQPDNQIVETDLTLHSLRIIYRATVISGNLRVEVGGSTVDAGWFPLEQVTGLQRVGLVDIGLRLWQERGVPPKPELANI